MSEAERLAAWCEELAQRARRNKANSVAADWKRACEDEALRLEAIAALLRTPAPPPAPEGWREVMQELLGYLDHYATVDHWSDCKCAECRARRMLAASPSPPHAEEP